MVGSFNCSVQFTHQNQFNDPKTGHKLNFSHQFVPKTNTESTINLHPSD